MIILIRIILIGPSASASVFGGSGFGEVASVTIVVADGGGLGRCRRQLNWVCQTTVGEQLKLKE